MNGRGLNSQTRNYSLSLAAWLGLLAPLLGGAKLYAQHKSLRFERISIEDGLSQSVVNTILQDRSGFLWFGTQEGLNRFDGYTFKVFKHRVGEPHGLSSSEINVLVEDRNGVLWVGTSKGLNRFDQTTRRFTRMPDRGDEANPANIFSLYEDREGYLWMSSLDGGVRRFDPETQMYTHYELGPAEGGAPRPSPIEDFFQDRRGVLWLASPDGLFLRDVNSGEIVPYEEDGPVDVEFRAFCLAEDDDGTLWLGTDEGLFRYDSESERFSYFALQGDQDEALGYFVARVIQADGKGNLWLGGGDALVKLNPKTGDAVWHRYDPVDSNSVGRDIFALHLDRSGVLWVGTYIDGLCRVDLANEHFAHYKHLSTDANSISDNNIRAMLVDRENDLWIGTYGGGLNRWDRKNQQFIRYRNDPGDTGSLSSDLVLGLHEDEEGGLWVGTMRGVNLLEKGASRFRHFRHDADSGKGPSDDLVYAILEDRMGRIWFGTGAGLDLYDRKSGAVTNYSHLPNDPQSLVQIDVMVLAEDLEGRLWLGTFGGISRFDPSTERFQNYTADESDPTSLSDNAIIDLYIDELGAVWIGTVSGLNRYLPESDSFMIYGEKDGFPNQVIYGVRRDQRGYLWLSTNSGLIQFHPQSGEVRNYQARDGLQSNEFNQGGAAAGEDGWLYFGGINGFNAFHPDQLRTSGHLPNIVITDFLLRNQPVFPSPEGESSPLRRSINFTRSLTLSHKDYLFSFEFAALSFSDPARNRYAYKLEGLDQEWVYTDAGNRRATYTKLAPGDYVFRVKGANKDGVWNDVGASLSLTITPPFYKTWWAYALYGLLVLISVPTLYYWRVHKVKVELGRERLVNEKLHQINRLKDDFLANTSHELRTPLNGIIGLAESLRDGVAGNLPNKAKADLKMIVSSGRRLSFLVDDILDFSKLKNKNLELYKRPVDLHAMAQVVLALSAPLVGRKSLELVNEVPEGLPSVMADENRLQQVLYNLIGNAIKFTEKGSVAVSAKVEDERVEMRVSDTGVGIPEWEYERIFESFERGNTAVDGAYPGTGLGLTVTRKLVELHGGRIWVESITGKGASFAFTLPFDEKGVEQPAERMPEPIAVANSLDLDQGEDPRLPDPEAAIEPLSGASRFRILIVDDDPINRQVLVNHLIMHSYNISEAANGREALKMIEEKPPFDLILLDIMMPRMSGYEVCRQLRNRYPVHELPVIFLTAKTQVTDMVAGFDVGANDYLTKPIAKSELLTRVRTHIRLLDINRNLEQKVAERTKQLFSKNEELSEMNRKLERASLTDPLTDLGNRRYLHKYLDKEVALVHRIYESWTTQKPGDGPPGADLIFLLFDLDHFKDVNDAFGHGAGDKVLVQIKSLMQQISREYDILVRWGGEEFLIVFRNAERDKAPVLAERLRSVIRGHKFKIGNNQAVRLTVSTGFACYPFLPEDPRAVSWERVVDIADLALYAAKKNGRDAWVGLDMTPATPSVNLMHLIRAETREMIDRGELKLMSSISEDRVTRWKPAKRPLIKDSSPG